MDVKVAETCVGVWVCFYHQRAILITHSPRTCSISLPLLRLVFCFGVLCCFVFFSRSLWPSWPGHQLDHLWWSIQPEKYWGAVGNWNKTHTKQHWQEPVCGWIPQWTCRRWETVNTYVNAVLNREVALAETSGWATAGGGGNWCTAEALSVKRRVWNRLLVQGVLWMCWSWDGRMSNFQHAKETNYREKGERGMVFGEARMATGSLRNYFAAA